MKFYVRFGNLPLDGKSKLHRGDAIIREEEGISVWNATQVNDVYFPLLPTNPTEDCYADFFYHLLGNKPVYLLTGTELDVVGSVGEPLLRDVQIVRDMTGDYEYLKKILHR